MQPADRDAVAERRSDGRDLLAGRVTVRFDEVELVGPGQNISAEGVFFVADTSLQVSVQIDGEERPRLGELIRVQTMGEGKVGVAVRFVDPR